MRFQVTVFIDCENDRQANAVMTERLGFDDDYGFEYELDWDRARKPDEIPDLQAAQEFLGFALFNHYKGKSNATAVLMRKAYAELAGREWDG